MEIRRDFYLDKLIKRKNNIQVTFKKSICRFRFRKDLCNLLHFPFLPNIICFCSAYYCHISPLRSSQRREKQPLLTAFHFDIKLSTET